MRSATNMPNRVGLTESGGCLQGARGGCQRFDVLECGGARLEVGYCRCEREGDATYDLQYFSSRVEQSAIARKKGFFSVFKLKILHAMCGAISLMNRP